jgi:hypothetical protein
MSVRCVSVPQPPNPQPQTYDPKPQTGDLSNKNKTGDVSARCVSVEQAPSALNPNSETGDTKHETRNPLPRTPNAGGEVSAGCVSVVCASCLFVQRLSPGCIPERGPFLSFSGTNSAGGEVSVGCVSVEHANSSLARSPQPEPHGLEKCRRPCIVAYRATLPPEWPLPPRNVADSCELTATT